MHGYFVSLFSILKATETSKRAPRARKSTTTTTQPADRKHRQNAVAAVSKHQRAISITQQRQNDEKDIRKAKLEEDPWTSNVQPLHVDCLACGKTIKLDSRRPDSYYRTNWDKHRKGCKKIQEYDQTTPSSLTNDIQYMTTAASKMDTVVEEYPESASYTWDAAVYYLETPRENNLVVPSLSPPVWSEDDTESNYGKSSPL
ncbi:hypothetical protein DXG01_004762 [Tephrocybe rancida]|nr:hypothetical protein DXG01_004762 [Tephrocybe rancida]